MIFAFEFPRLLRATFQFFFSIMLKEQTEKALDRHPIVIHVFKLSAPCLNRGWFRPNAPGVRGKRNRGAPSPYQYINSCCCIRPEENIRRDRRALP